ncbi:MAG: hypothetical protein ACJARD_001219 [Alphaproteobacteria bacterium]|jgi:hypothetical protein
MNNDKNAQSEIFMALKKIREFKNTPIADTGYNAFMDTNASQMPCLDNAMRIVAPMQRSIMDHISLVQKARMILKDYLKMKSFILDIYAPSIALEAGLYDREAQEKMAQSIALEMEDNLKSLTTLSSRLANEAGSRLDKELAHNELKALTDDLLYRVASYKRHHQSYLMDQNSESQIMYEMN